MITGRYQTQSDLGIVYVDVRQTGYNEFTAQFQEMICGIGQEKPGGYWSMTAKLLNNCLIQDVRYYHLNLNFADDRLTITEGGKNPFLRPHLQFGGVYDRAKALVN